jgi:hypothetical protein
MNLYIDSVDIDAILDELTDSTSCVVYNLTEDIGVLREQNEKLIVAAKALLEFDCPDYHPTHLWTHLRYAVEGAALHEPTRMGN